MAILDIVPLPPGITGVVPMATWEVHRMPAKEFLNVRETAERLGVHENTVRNWEERGILHGFKLPGSGFRRFPREEIERMRQEMLGGYAPASELSDEPRSGVRGKPVDGDLL